ncbi:helix-turn-helix transcriptional regulator [Mucilaginibacter sp.]|uniref:AraC family transcriptional regulator n=1 Tax=Mucilaginibacter sp. TaxID=1882438 RepID=UPI00261ED353|nr:helix-turn-helix domain-containing protein [Mucilaginibacter sp.]MDB4919531.1 AraC family transcriptional regulator [Mucilaginibacter sp.]
MSIRIGNRVDHVNADIVFTTATEKYHRSEVVIEYHALTRILSGEMRVVQPDHTYTFVAGDTFLLPRNLPAAVIKRPKEGRPYKSVSIYLKPDRLRDYYRRHEFKATQPYNHKIKTFGKHLLLESFFASLLPYFEMDEVLPGNIISVKVEEAISILRNIDESTDALLAYFEEPGKINLAEFMEKNYMFNMTMGKFGYLTCRSLTTFKRDFKKAFNTTPQKWLTQKRLELAHYQLSEKQRKPIDVYFDVGFENLSHFSYAFKKQFGYSPNALVER